MGFLPNTILIAHLPSHYSETMPERTNPPDALKRLSWYLNFHKGETVSLNQVSRSTGLAWATVKKYTQAIERVQRIAPSIRSTTDGIQVGSQNVALGDLFEQPTRALAVYLLVQSQENGDATEEIELADHEHLFEEHSEALEKMESLGWIDLNEEYVSLTPLGVSIAGPIYSEITNGNREDEYLRTYQRKGSILAVIEDGEADQSDRKRRKLKQSETAILYEGGTKTENRYEYERHEFKSPEGTYGVA